MRPAPIKLFSPLPVSECRARIADRLDIATHMLEGTATALEPPITGKLRNSTFRLSMYGGGRGGPYAPVAHGHLAASEHGTLIEIEFRMKPTGTMIIGGLASFLFLADVLLLIGFIRTGTSFRVFVACLISLLWFTGLGIAGWLYFKFCVWLVRGNRSEIEAFLRKTLQATDAQLQAAG